MRHKMDPNISWIYLAIFLLIPLARIIPRLMARRRAQGGGGQPPQEILEKSPPQTTDIYRREPGKGSKPRTKSMLVLGALNRGSKTFESIQKDTGLESGELDTVLEDLEKNGLLAVRQKSGLLGTKVELFPTDKGFKEYYS